jgi:RimJ/RimL family protein N-acetyltransferase
MYGGGLGDVRPMTLNDATRWVSGLQKHDHAWTIEAGSVIGHIRLDRADFRDRKASLAIGIDDPARLGKGFGTEAIMLVQAYAFRQHRLSVRVVDYNRRAIRAYEKCGFRVEGRERSCLCGRPMAR